MSVGLVHFSQRNNKTIEFDTSTTWDVLPELGGRDVWIGGVPGGGGGGGTSTNGGNGTDSSFDTLITFEGAKGGGRAFEEISGVDRDTLQFYNGGKGSCFGGSSPSTSSLFNYPAENGQNSTTNSGGLGGEGASSTGRPGGGGGAGYLSDGGDGSGGGSVPQVSTTPSVNSGAGGGGTSFTASGSTVLALGGGGGGGSQIVWHRITLPAEGVTITVTIGAAGAAGTGGNATAGATGKIILAWD